MNSVHEILFEGTANLKPAMTNLDALLADAFRVLRPGGRLVLVEYKGEDPSIPILPSHKMTVAQAKLEVEAEGFVLTTTDSSLPRQHVLTFTKR